jgi:hypothetical protein
MEEQGAKGAGWVPDPEVLFEEIRNVAFQIYEARRAHDIPGDDVSDWMDAEAQVRAKYGL